MLRKKGWIRTLFLAIGLASTQVPGVAFASELGAADNDKVFRSRFEQYTLSITNYLAGCAVAIDVGRGGELGILNPEPSTTLSFPEGWSIWLQGLPMDGFVWGYWSGTDYVGYSSDASVTMSSDRDVRVCCPSAATPNAKCS